MDEQRTSAWAGYGTVVMEDGLLIWRPSPTVARHAPDGFALRLSELRETSLRLIRPASGFNSAEDHGRVGAGSFFYDARIGGLAILIARGLDAEPRQMHDTGWLYLQKLLNSRTWLRRQPARGIV